MRFALVFDKKLFFLVYILGYIIIYNYFILIYFFILVKINCIYLFECLQEDIGTVRLIFMPFMV